MFYGWIFKRTNVLHLQIIITKPFRPVSRTSVWWRSITRRESTDWNDAWRTRRRWRNSLSTDQTSSIFVRCSSANEPRNSRHHPRAILGLFWLVGYLKILNPRVVLSSQHIEYCILDKLYSNEIVCNATKWFVCVENCGEVPQRSCNSCQRIHQRTCISHIRGQDSDHVPHGQFEDRLHDAWVH